MRTADSSIATTMMLLTLTRLLYQSPTDLPGILRVASQADLVVKHSGVGMDDELLEREVLLLGSPRTKSPSGMSMLPRH